MSSSVHGWPEAGLYRTITSIELMKINNSVRVVYSRVDYLDFNMKHWIYPVMSHATFYHVNTLPH